LARSGSLSMPPLSCEGGESAKALFRERGERGRTHVSPNGLDLSNVEDERVHETENVEGHLLRREGAAALSLDTLSDGVGSVHETGTTSPSCEREYEPVRGERGRRRKQRTDDGSGNAEVLSPRLGRPAVEESLERDLRLRVETVVTEETVVGREGKDDLSGASGELEGSLLRLDGTEETEDVGEHDTVSELGAVVETVDLATVLGKGGEGEDVVEVHSETLVFVVDVVDKGFDVLLGTLVEGNDSERGTLGTALLVDRLVVLDAA
jgi:hypothetical protein